MALRICSECRGKASDRAMWCPQCGKPSYANMLRAIIWVYVLWMLLCLLVAIGVYLVLVANGFRIKL